MTEHHCAHQWAATTPDASRCIGWQCAHCADFAPGTDPPGADGAPVVVLRKNVDTSFRVVDPSTYPHGHTTFDEEEPIHEHWARFGNGHTVIDIGACFGSFTLPALARGARVVAFEPSDDGLQILNKNVGVNGWWSRLDLWSATLWDDTPYSQALFDDVFGRSYPATRGKAWFATLDSIWPRTRDTMLHAIKIDVEGAEWHVLQGALETIKRHRPTLLIEDHDGIAPGLIVSDYPASIDSSLRICSLLRDLGYETTPLTFASNRKYIVAEVK